MGLRGAYYDHLAERKEALKSVHPDKTPMEILKLARNECPTQLYGRYMVLSVQLYLAQSHKNGEMLQFPLLGTQFLLRWRAHPDRVASIKGMTKSELSRRRLKVQKSGEGEQGETPNGESANGESANGESANGESANASGSGDAPNGGNDSGDAPSGGSSGA